MYIIVCYIINGCLTYWDTVYTTILYIINGCLTVCDGVYTNFTNARNLNIFIFKVGNTTILCCFDIFHTTRIYLVDILSSYLTYNRIGNIYTVCITILCFRFDRISNIYTIYITCGWINNNVAGNINTVSIFVCDISNLKSTHIHTRTCTLCINRSQLYTSTTVIIVYSTTLYRTRYWNRLNGVITTYITGNFNILTYITDNFNTLNYITT